MEAQAQKDGLNKEIRMNGLAKSVIASVSTAIIVTMLVWLGSTVQESIAWSKDVEEIRQEQLKTSQVVQQVLEQQLKRDIRDISKEIRGLDLARGGDEWTDSDEKYYLLLMDALQAAQDQLDDLED